MYHDPDCLNCDHDTGTRCYECYILSGDEDRDIAEAKSKLEASIKKDPTRFKGTVKQFFEHAASLIGMKP